MMNEQSLDKQVPIGFTDLFFQQATHQLWLSRTLGDLFACWGYTPIIPPTVAYAENMAAEELPQVYRFFDREGHTLALRADLTLPVARIVGTRLYDQLLPLRLYYVERVFRHVPPQAGQRREFTQAGAELIGADTPRADAEIVAMAAAALAAIGLPDFRLALGQMGFFRALLAESSLSREQIEQLKEAIDRRNDAHLCTVLQQFDLPAHMHTLLRALPTLAGGRETIDRARQLAPIAAAQHALDRLGAVLDLLEVYGLQEHILIDLGEVRGMDYYTGLVFQGYTAGLGSALCSGGRYNDLIGRFGPNLAAVGFGIDVDLARLATDPPPAGEPLVVVECCPHPACYRAVRTLRAQGVRVMVDTLDRHGSALAGYAHSLGAEAALCLRPGRWQIRRPDGTAYETDAGHLQERGRT